MFNMRITGTCILQILRNPMFSVYIDINFPNRCCSHHVSNTIVNRFQISIYYCVYTAAGARREANMPTKRDFSYSVNPINRSNSSGTLNTHSSRRASICAPLKGYNFSKRIVSCVHGRSTGLGSGMRV